MFKTIANTLRINHYIKNTIVLIPLIFSANYNNPLLCIKTLMVLIAFCAISSAVYIFNDIIDINNDRTNPIKKDRPITCGEISKKQALLLMLIGLFISLFISFKINFLTILMLLGYLLLNIFYSIYLKNITLIDVACIALGFIFRILAGCFAIGVKPSPLVIIMTFFASMFFTFAKRKFELELIIDKDIQRKSLSNINIEIIKQFILICAILSISFYLTYMLDSKTIERMGTDLLYITVIPFTLIVFRLLLLINANISKKGDPIYYIEKDSVLRFLFLLYLIVLFIII